MSIINNEIFESRQKVSKRKTYLTYELFTVSKYAVTLRIRETMPIGTTSSSGEEVMSSKGIDSSGLTDPNLHVFYA